MSQEQVGEQEHGEKALWGSTRSVSFHASQLRLWS